MKTVRNGTAFPLNAHIMGIFAEVIENIAPETSRGAAIPHHAIEHATLRRFDALRFLFGKFVVAAAFLYEIPARGNVAIAPKKQAFRRLPVSSGTAGLLVIRLDAFRHVVMNHIAHVGFVYAHAERIRGNHDQRIVIDKAPLTFLAMRRRHASMVARRRNSLLAKPFRKSIDVLARGAVNDAAFPRMLGNIARNARTFSAWAQDVPPRSGCWVGRNP